MFVRVKRFLKPCLEVVVPYEASKKEIKNIVKKELAYIKLLERSQFIAGLQTSLFSICMSQEIYSMVLSCMVNNKNIFLKVLLYSVLLRFFYKRRFL
jgi:hypothetical protein